MRKMLTHFSKNRIRIFYLILVLLMCPVLITNSGTIFAKSESQQEKQKITGTVVDANGMALPGVTILIKGTSAGAITDMDGKFSVSAGPEDVLVFKFVGYLTEEMTVGANTNMDIKLVEDIIGLDEVVVTGYGVQKKSDLTGSVASVSGDKIAEMPVIGVSQALQGRAAGVSVISNTGLPGSGVSIAIRGISSINGTQPLVIVDGIRSSLNDLNADDIESVEILKDASSAAIYGSAGGNGVVLVTTKKGKSGKMVTTLGYYKGYEKPWKKMDMMNTQNYAELQNIVVAQTNMSATKANQIRQPWTTQPDTLKDFDWQDMTMQTGIVENYDFTVSSGSEKSTFFMSMNYVKQQGVLKKTDFNRFNVRINSDHKLSKYIKVGENITFVRAQRKGFPEWMFQDSYNSPFTTIMKMVPYLPQYSTRYDDTYPGMTGSEFPMSLGTVDPVFNNPANDSLDKKWTYHPNAVNPMVAIDNMDRRAYNYQVGGQIYLEISPLKGMTHTTKISGYTNFDITESYLRSFYYNSQQANPYNDLTKDINQQYGWIFQDYINYNTTFAEFHNISIMAGIESQYDKQQAHRMYLEDMYNEDPEMKWYFDASTNDTSDLSVPTGAGWEATMFSAFGRINYDFKSKYLLTANVRMDKSSRFGPDYRTGYFPSFSLGWKFSEEEFIKNLGFISFGKLRYGYGQNGANAPTNYAYLARINSTLASYNYPFGPAGTSASQGAALVQLPNTEMHWETMIMSNFGVDLGFLNNKLNITVDYFKKTSKEMLDYQTLPATATMYQWTSHATNLGGDARPMVNSGTIENSGIEFTIGYRKMEGDLKATFDLNGTFTKNKVVDLVADSIYKGAVGVNLANICLTSEGNPMSQFYGYKTEGLFQHEDAATRADGSVYIWNQPYTTVENTTTGLTDTTWAQAAAKPGDFRFSDLNHDGIIDARDRDIIGNPIPKFIFGFSTTLEYKGFDLNIFFEGKFGHQLFNGAQLEFMSQINGPNRLNKVMDQYREPIYSSQYDASQPAGTLLYEGNTETDLPRLDPRAENQNLSRVSDFYVESGNYVRLKNLQLGYTIPLNLSSKFGIDKLRFYIGGKNLITMTKYTGWDPEFDSAPTVDYATGRKDMMQQGIDRVGNYPQSKSFLFGVNLTF